MFFTGLCGNSTLPGRVEWVTLSQFETGGLSRFVHDLNLAARFADQIVLLNHGRFVAGGTPAQVLTPELIREAFGIEPSFVSTEHPGLHLIFE